MSSVSLCVDICSPIYIIYNYLVAIAYSISGKCVGGVRVQETETNGCGLGIKTERSRRKKVKGPGASQQEEFPVSGGARRWGFCD